MTTIAAGASGAYTFSGGETVIVQLDPGEVAELDVLSSTGQQRLGGLITSTRAIGPFVAGDVMALTAVRGAVDWTIQYAPSAQPASLTSSQVAAGSTHPMTGVISRGAVAIVGDSLVAFGDVAGALTQTASGVLAVTGGKTSCSVLAWTDAYLKSGRLDLITNRGVGSTLIDGTATKSVLGTNIPQIGDGATAGALTDAAHGIWVHSGVNHLSTTNDPAAPTAAAIVQKVRRMLGILAPRKAWVVVEGIYPLGLNSPASHYARHTEVPIINAGIAAACAQYPNVIYLDPSILSNDGGVTGDPKYYLASDLLHLNTYGAQTLGYDYARRQLPGQLTLLSAFRSAKTVLMPEMAGTSGGKTANTGIINGTVPGNMRVINLAGSPTVNLTTANNRLTMAIDNTAQLTSATVTLDLNSRTAYLGSLALNDVIVSSATISVTNPVGLLGHDLYLSQNFDDGVGATRIDVSAMAQSNQELINGNAPKFSPASYGPITLRTQPFTIASALTSLNTRLTIILAAGGSVTVDFGDLTLDAVVAA